MKTTYEYILDTKKTIVKYIPISRKYFELNEIFKKYILFENINKTSKISCISNENSIIEFLLHSIYNLENILFILVGNPENKKEYEHINSIYYSNADNIIAVKDGKDILKNIVNENDLLYITVDYRLDYNLNFNFKNESDNDIITIGKTKISDNGNYIIRFKDIPNINTNDKIMDDVKNIFIILSNLFENSYIHYSEINNNVLYMVFIKKIQRQIDNKIIVPLHKKINENLLNNNYIFDDKYKIQKSIIYCKKYDIPYFEKYNTTKIDSFISRNILSEMYGIQEPILYKFKTPFQTYISDKIVINPRLQSLHSKSKSTHSKTNSILKTIHSRIQSQKTYKNKSKTLTTKSPKSLSRRDTIGSIFRDIFSQSTKKHTQHKSKFQSTKNYSRRTKKSSLKRSNISLLNPIFPSNNQLEQVGRLIDSRRDFTKSEKDQTWLYDQLKEQFRYYKGKGQRRNVPNLDIMVQQRLGDQSISQAWLKMYEIITDCSLVPTNSHISPQKGTYRSFHLCEAPGTFINALNNYILTKTQYTNFEWHSQSLNPKIAKIKDTYHLISRHPERWDWGADGTGDITQVRNIKHYKKKVSQRPPVNLITSDCGLEWGNPKYEFVAFASYVAILDILPVRGAMLYKILSPIDLPLLWNLIYITYTNFKEMYFFKPVQNAQSREFYIVAKDYLGTDQKVLDKLLEIVQRWGKLENAPTPYKAKWLTELDLFGDQYPVEFVSQVLNISERLAQNYINSIERIIYYVDNYDVLGDEYKKHIEKYIEEKNEDWIRKYRPRKLENKWIL